MGKAIQAILLHAAVKKMQTFPVHVMPYCPMIHIRLFPAGGKAQKTEQGNEGDGRARTAPQFLPHALAGSRREEGGFYAQLRIIIFLYISQHGIDKSDIVRLMIKDGGKLGWAAGMGKKGPVEYLPGMQDCYAKKDLEGIKDSIGCAKIIDLTLKKCLHAMGSRLVNRKNLLI
ncbi:MAG: hypothetical protein II737_03115 [Mailhella sp.]|nr:hypothetical protein [Mailhella sp.]